MICSVLKTFHISKLTPITETFLISKRLVSILDPTVIKMETFDLIKFYDLYCHFCPRKDIEEILAPL